MVAVSSLMLRAGALNLELAPAIGGCVASFQRDGVDLMRPLSAAEREAGNARGSAMFPMLPYANRIAGNAFTFRHKHYYFTANNPPERFNVHGTGWRRPWRVKAATPSEADLQLDVEASTEQPYTYRATQRYVLSADSLAVDMTVTNLAAEPMPFGIGLHPWFPRDPDVTVQFTARSFYLEEPEGVSGNPISLPPELDFSASRPLPSGWRNNDYGGWGGRLDIRFPSRGIGITLTADPVFKHLMFYADPTKPFFCAEPQSNASCAFNRQGGFDDPNEGVIVLAPGETASGTIRLAITAL